MRKRLILILCVLMVLCGIASAQSTPTCLQGTTSCTVGAAATGNGFTINLNNSGGAGALILSVINSAGTFTIVVEISRDGDSYTTALVTNLLDGIMAASITAAGKYSVLAPNMTVRARISACSSCATIVKAWPVTGVISKSFSLSTAPGTVPIASGGTGATSKAAAFDALSPMSASGDIIYGGASGTGTRLGKGSDGQVLQLASGLPSWVTISTGLTVDTTTVSGGTIGNIFFHKTGNVLGELTTTGSGTVVALATSPTFTTDITAPLHIGGTGTGSSLTLKSTSGVGATDFIDFLVGNNGATRGGRFDTSGNLSVGLGTTTAPTKFVVGDTSSSTPRGLMSWQASDDTSSAHLHMRKTRGTFASPTIVVTGDILGRLVFSGYDGASYLEMGSIRTVVTGTVAATRIPTQMIFSTATDAAPSVLTTALTIGADQKATFAGAVAASTYNGNTLTTGTYTLTGTAGKTLNFTNSLTLSGTDSSTLNIGGGGTLGTAAFTAASAYEVPLTFGSGISRSVNAVSLDQTFAPTWTARHIFTVNGGLSAPGVTATGTWVTGGDATTTKPYALIQPTGATSTGWSTAGTGLGVNAATGFAGNLLDMQLNGVSKFKVLSTGGFAIQSNQVSLDTGSLTAPAGWYLQFATRAYIDSPADAQFRIHNNADTQTFILRAAGVTATPNIGLGAADAAAPVAQTVSVQSVVAGTTNTPGAAFSLVGSLATGTGVAGTVGMKTGALSPTSGTTQQTAVFRTVIGANKVLANNTATTITNVSVASNSTSGGVLDYTIEVFDGTDLQIETGSISFMVTNKGGVFTGNTTAKFGNQQNTTSGTLTCTWTITGANPALLQLNANSSLTPSSGYPRLVYTIRNQSASNDIAVQ